MAPGDVPNALSFALRRRWVVTTHACETLDELELEGMLAHEVVHLRDGEATVASLFVVLAGGADLLFRGAGVLAAALVAALARGARPAPARETRPCRRTSSTARTSRRRSSRGTRPASRRRSGRPGGRAAA